MVLEKTMEIKTVVSVMITAMSKTGVSIASFLKNFLSFLFIFPPFIKQYFYMGYIVSEQSYRDNKILACEKYFCQLEYG